MTGQDRLVDAAVAVLRAAGMTSPRFALVLGSGLGSFAARLESSISVSTSEIPDYPASTVKGHAGRIVYGRLRDKKRLSPPILVFQGRIHPYEGGLPVHAILNIRLCASLGTRGVLLTNAAGGIHPDMRPGDLMLHDDILSVPLAPTRRPHRMLERRIIDFHTSPYDAGLQTKIEGSAKAVGERLLRGVYCYVSGPTYETPAEVRMLRAMGADAVGMSTYPEVAAATDLGLPVAAISLISNQAAGLAGHALTHTDVTINAEKAGARLSSLLSHVLMSL